MSERPWFGPKRFGYGYSPITWEGWLAIAVYALVLVAGMFAIRLLIDPPPGPWRAAIPLGWVVFATAIFLWFAASRTEGQMRWRWGGRP